MRMLLMWTTSARIVLFIVGIRAPLVKAEPIEIPRNVEIKQEIGPGPHLAAKLRKLVVAKAIGCGPKVGAEHDGIGLAD